MVIYACFTIQHRSMLKLPKNDFFKVHIVRSAAFCLWMCGGDNCIIVLLFCNNRFSSVDASFSIMFDVVTWPAVSNMSYNTSYAPTMYVSLLYLIGSTKTVLASYTYKFSMYWIPQSLVNGNIPVISVNTLPVLGSARLIAANAKSMVSYLGGGKICL